MKTIGLENAVESFEMHDRLGNTCAAALFKPGDAEYEVYLWDFNSSTPRRVTGDVKRCKDAMQRFYERQTAKGFGMLEADEHGKPIPEGLPPWEAK